MKLLLLFISLLGFSAANRDPKSRSGIECLLKQDITIRDLGMVKLGDKYYYANNSVSLNWNDSRTFCRSRGLELASVETQVENDLLALHLRTVIPSWRDRWHFWLGGSDAGHQGRWKWVSSGRDVTFSDWLAGEPDNSGGDEDCLQMSAQNDGRHWWQDSVCSLERSFVCENDCPI